MDVYETFRRLSFNTQLRPVLPTGIYDWPEWDDGNTDAADELEEPRTEQDPIPVEAFARELIPIDDADGTWGPFDRLKRIWLNTLSHEDTAIGYFAISHQSPKAPHWLHLTDSLAWQ